MRLTAEKRLSVLTVNMDRKKEKEQNEMLGELKSAIKDQFGSLRSQVYETSSEGSGRFNETLLCITSNTKGRV